MESAPQLVLQIYILIRDPQAAKVRILYSYVDHVIDPYFLPLVLIIVSRH